MNSSDYPGVLYEALIREIWAELGRQGIKGARGLAERLGTPNHTSINDRISLTKQDRVAISVPDLIAYEEALGLRPFELLHRAMAAVGPREQSGESEVS